MSDPTESKSTNESFSEDPDDSILTLNDIVELENVMIENAAAVLGAANDKTCSYNDGYLKRQALYSCLTCIPEARTDPDKGAGICLACSYHCHDGHELVELYTKRNFRCDCGNSKFNGIKCNLTESKDEVNQENVYNQNFSGIYCVCHRPYPDAEDPLPDEMIQCIICEDWYHSRHLAAEVPSNSFAEMVCGTCISSHDFLLYYDESIGKSEETTAEVDVENADVKAEKKCQKPSEKSSNPGTTKFWKDISWRQELCTCPECMTLYENEKVLFLLDSEDSVQLYEEKGKAKAKEVVEGHNRDFLNSLNRVQQVEVIAGFNDLKDHLQEYLKKFVENKKIVREEDIKEFFDRMSARKKMKVSVPYHCR